MLCFGFTVFSAMNQSLGGPDTRPRLFACLPFSNARSEFLFLLSLLGYARPAATGIMLPTN